MIGKITEDGWLEIERAGEMKDQNCPFDNACGREDTARCGDWCPLFGEPLIMVDSGAVLKICQERHLVFDEFEDER